MKNVPESYLSESVSKSLTNSYSYRYKPQSYLLTLEKDDPASALSDGFYHHVEDWVALELTAEQMVGDEVNTVTTYVADDSHHMWEAVKDKLLPYELAAGEFLLQAADPTQVDWLQNHWWDHDETNTVTTTLNPH